MTKLQDQTAHRLTNIRVDAKRGLCCLCGDVDLVKHGRNADGSQRWKCKTADRLQKAGYVQKRHSISLLNIETMMAVCEACGPTLIGKAGIRKGIQRYRCVASIAKSAKPCLNLVKAKEHYISEVDVVARTGVCSTCGPVKVKLRGHYKNVRSWRCAEYVAPPRKIENVRRSRLKFHYDLSLEDYNDMVDEQNGACAICKKPTDGQWRDSLHVDHDHTTGKIRGLLCRVCNVGLGHFGESIENLNAAIDYIQYHKIRMETFYMSPNRSQVSELIPFPSTRPPSIIRPNVHPAFDQPNPQQR